MKLVGFAKESKCWNIVQLVVFNLRKKLTLMITYLSILSLLDKCVAKVVPALLSFNDNSTTDEDKLQLLFF
jgi:hypothetical protein